MRYLNEFIILVIQLIIFYIFPLFAETSDAMGLVFLIIISTFALSIVFGVISEKKLKYFYPIVIAVLFIPSVFIFYNDSALIHALWYLVISYIGVFLGIIFHIFIIRE